MEIYANKIPAEMVEDVKTVVNRVSKNRLRADRKDVEYLFKIYHEYLAPYDKQSIGCRACRAKVCGIFFQILNVWNKKTN